MWIKRNKRCQDNFLFSIRHTFLFCVLWSTGIISLRQGLGGLLLQECKELNRTQWRAPWRKCVSEVSLVRKAALHVESCSKRLFYWRAKTLTAQSHSQGLKIYIPTEYGCGCTVAFIYDSMWHVDPTSLGKKDKFKGSVSKGWRFFNTKQLNQVHILDCSGLSPKSSFIEFSSPGLASELQWPAR